MAEPQVHNGYRYYQQPDGSWKRGERVAQPTPSMPEAIDLPRTQQQVEEEERKNREEGYKRGDRVTDVASSLRKEFQSTDFAKNYNVALGTYYSALNTSPTPEGDQSLIVSFARMLDPNSVVREGEFVVAASNEAAFTRFLNTAKREFGMDEAGRLSPQGRERLREEMRNLVVNRFKRPYDQTRQMYEGYAQASGVAPELVVGQPPERAFPSGILDSPEAATEATTVATGDTQIDAQIPAEYQQRHLDYLRQNWGRMDGREYAQFRSQLDQEYGLTPNPIAYREAVTGFNELAQAGGTPQQLGAVPSPQVPLEGIDAVMNTAAQSPGGAGFISFSNAATAGIPIALTGGQENFETIRDLNPAASFAGELAGGIAGTAATGAGLKGASLLAGASPRLASLLANPMTTEVGYGSLYGATQDGASGATVGALGALGGGLGGKLLGQAFPDTFAGQAMTEAREAVPSIDQLKQQAARQYQAVEATGATAQPTDTAQMFQDATRILQDEGVIDPRGRFIEGDTATRKAYQLMEGFAGQPMTPTQAGTVRNVLSDVARNQDPAQRRIGSMLLDQFDTWADPVLPGVAVPRETARKYIQGQQIQEAIDLAGADKSRLTQSGYENALRGQFRNLDKATIRGSKQFTPAVTNAVQRVARGDALSNTARGIGKFAPTSPMSMAVGGGAVGMLGNMAGGPALGIPLAIGAAGVGTASRALATQRAERAADDALLTALGGDQFEAMRQQAIEEAMLRGRRIGGGIFGSGAVAANRDLR